MKKSESGHFQDESTKDRIIREAVKLFSEKGYHGTSVDDITRAIGISKGAFYWYFKSKEELLESFLREWEGRFLDGLIHAVEEVSAGTLAKLEKMKRYTSAFAFYNRELCVSFDTLSGELVGGGHRIEEKFRCIYGKYQDFLFRLLEEGKQEKVVRPELDSRLTALILMSFHHGLLLQWSINRDHLDGEAFLATYNSILNNGIFSFR